MIVRVGAGFTPGPRPGLSVAATVLVFSASPADILRRSLTNRTAGPRDTWSESSFRMDTELRTVAGIVDIDFAKSDKDFLRSAMRSWSPNNPGSIPCCTQFAAPLELPVIAVLVAATTRARNCSCSGNRYAVRRRLRSKSPNLSKRYFGSKPPLRTRRQRSLDLPDKPGTDL